MSEEMTDREKKIAEIQEAKQKADKTFEYITKDLEQADDWIELLLSELERLETAYQQQLQLANERYFEIDRLQKEVGMLREAMEGQIFICPHCDEDFDDFDDFFEHMTLCEDDEEC